MKKGRKENKMEEGNKRRNIKEWKKKGKGSFE